MLQKSGKNPVEVGSFSLLFTGIYTSLVVFLDVWTINSFIIVFQEMALFAIRTAVPAMEARNKTESEKVRESFKFGVVELYLEDHPRYRN